MGDVLRVGLINLSYAAGDEMRLEMVVTAGEKGWFLEGFWNNYFGYERNKLFFGMTGGIIFHEVPLYFKKVK